MMVESKKKVFSLSVFLFLRMHAPIEPSSRTNRLAFFFELNVYVVSLRVGHDSKKLDITERHG